MPAIFIHRGDHLDHTPATDLVVGAVVVLGELVAIATHPIPAGKLGSLALTGVFALPVAPATAAVTGEPAFWLPASEQVTHDPAAPGAIRCGCFARDVVVTDPQAQVLLGR